MPEYKCLACGYSGDDEADKICSQCLADFPDQGDHGAPAMCDCGSEDFDLACPKCSELMTERDESYDASPEVFDAEG